MISNTFLPLNNTINLDIAESLENYVKLECENLNMSQTQIDSCLTLLKSSLSLDIVTGLYDIKFSDILLDYYNAMANNNDNVYMISGDFYNLYNANLAIGKRNVNKMMNAIIGFYKESIAACGITIVDGVRTGGDEFAFYIAGVEEHKIQEIIQSANNKVEKFIDNLQLQNLEHSKPVKLPGVGVSIAYAKFPIVDKAGLHSYIDTQMDQIKREGDTKITYSANYFNNNKEMLQDIEKSLQLYCINSGRSFPFDYMKSPDNESNGFILRKQQVKCVAKANNMNIEQTNFLLKILEKLYDPIDKHNMYNNEDYVSFLTQFNENNDIKICNFEITNLSGLNKIFSHYGANIVIEKIKETVSNDFGKTIMFYRGGGIISCIIQNPKDMLLPDMHIEHVIKKIMEEVGECTIQNFANQYNLNVNLQSTNCSLDTKIADIPSARNYTTNQFVVGARVGDIKDCSTVEALNRIDRRLEEQKNKLSPNKELENQKNKSDSNRNHKSIIKL